MVSPLHNLRRWDIRRNHRTTEYVRRKKRRNGILRYNVPLNIHVRDAARMLALPSPTPTPIKTACPAMALIILLAIA